MQVSGVARARKVRPLGTAADRGRTRSPSNQNNSRFRSLPTARALPAGHPRATRNLGGIPQILEEVPPPSPTCRLWRPRLGGAPADKTLGWLTDFNAAPDDEWHHSSPGIASLHQIRSKSCRQVGLSCGFFDFRQAITAV